MGFGFLSPSVQNGGETGFSMKKRVAQTNETEAESIVPEGFRHIAHPCFSRFKRPTFRSSSPSSSVSSSSSSSSSNYSSSSSPAPSSTLLAQNPQLRSAESALAATLDDNEGGCPICLLELSSPVTLCSCLHSFCLHCLKKWTTVSEACPLCKVTITGFISTNVPSGSSKEDEHDQTLYTLRTLTDRIVQHGEKLSGMVEASKVNRALSRNSREKKVASAGLMAPALSIADTTSAEWAGKAPPNDCQSLTCPNDADSRSSSSEKLIAASKEVVAQLKAVAHEPEKLALALRDGKKLIHAMDCAVADELRSRSRSENEDHALSESQKNDIDLLASIKPSKRMNKRRRGAVQDKSRK